MGHLTFRSKIDWWLRAAILFPVIGGVVALLAIALVKSPFLAFAVSPVVLVSVGLPVWILRSTYYTFGDRELSVRCGPFEWRVPLRDIRAVRPTHSLLSSPALSLDRLRIEYGVRQSIMVSPDDTAEFLRELKGRVPGVQLANAHQPQGMPVLQRDPAYLGIAILFAGLVTWGFWRSYFGPVMAGTVERPGIVHLHAAIFVGWVLLLIAQAALASAGRLRLHRQIGVAGMAYGAFVFLVGVMVSIGAPALRVRAGDFPIEVGAMVAILSLADLVLFGAFLACAFAYRLQPQVHKQWVIAATAALGGAAVGRVLKSDSLGYLLVWLSPVLLIVVIDVASRRRLSVVPFVSGGLIVASFFKTQLFAAPIWREFGRALVGPFV